jgi:hypothetical protein
MFEKKCEDLREGELHTQEARKDSLEERKKY